MQITANTTAFILRARNVILSVIAPRPARVSTDVFSVFIPGQGMSGEYPTTEEAEAAMRHLPYSVRQQATICDADGYVMCR